MACSRLSREGERALKEWLEAGLVKARACESAGGPLSLVPAQHWRDYSLNYSSQIATTFALDRPKRLLRVEFASEDIATQLGTSLSALQKTVAETAPNSSDAPNKGPTRKPLTTAAQALRPRLWDWEPVLIELMMIAEFDGLEGTFGDFKKRGTQAKLEKWFADYFAAQGTGGHPSESELRKRALWVKAALAAR